MKLSDVNKLRPHMMRTKLKNDIIENGKPENEEKQENGEEKQENGEIITTGEADSEMQQFQTAQSLQQQTSQNNNNNNDNNKRKSMEEGLSPDRTRPRYSDLTVMSN